MEESENWLDVIVRIDISGTQGDSLGHPKHAVVDSVVHAVRKSLAAAEAQGFNHPLSEDLSLTVSSVDADEGDLPGATE